MATVLVVDDAEEARDLAKSLLELSGHHTLALPSEEDTIEIAAELRPGAIVLNVEAADEDAWTILKELKRDPRTARIPVVVCSRASLNVYSPSAGKLCITEIPPRVPNGAPGIRSHWDTYPEFV